MIRYLGSIPSSVLLPSCSLLVLGYFISATETVENGLAETRVVRGLAVRRSVPSQPEYSAVFNQRVEGGGKKDAAFPPPPFYHIYVGATNAQISAVDKKPEKRWGCLRSVTGVQRCKAASLARVVI
ncbi:hypothetical protein F5Y06DRAFT_266652 [Hypoxylon sp. FL0890]|nr:hypothetical protein F5Y06DRAFT_266652 [Hypoxylon sp. FL0890]